MKCPGGRGCRPPAGPASSPARQRSASRPAPRAAPGASPPAPSAAPRRHRRPRRPPRPQPVTIADLATVELAGVPTTGYARTDGQPALSLSVSQDVRRQHRRPSPTRSPPSSTRSARSTPTSVTRHGRLRPVRRSSRSRRDGLLHEGGLGALFADPDDLPVPVQPPLDARRRGQHPALDPDRAGDHADHRRSRSTS